jgi:hypothetical protein
MKTKNIMMAFILTSVSMTVMGQSKYIQAVDDFVPAPGQFVNVLPKYEVGDTQQSMNDKCTAAIGNGANGMISLGGYGGYVIFHFDHSVVNVKDKMDLYIRGNGFTNNSEPGIVMVSKDNNGNGKPDDTWYELKGSADEDSIGKSTYNYTITYSRAAADSTLTWVDSKGESATVIKNTFHKQSYYPLWIADNVLSFTGTLLPKNAVNKGTSTTPYYVLSNFRYGYVDNSAVTDSTGCSFNIEWAVDADRQSVSLDKIDFVKVYCAENQTAGWLGETSTEVTGAEDLHPNATVSTGILSTNAAISSDEQLHTSAYNLNGQKTVWTSGRKQLMIINGKKVIR